VLSGAGETSCGNTRCTPHGVNLPMPPLSTLELPFVYEEHEETKTALVKIVLCKRCVKKLMWKRNKEKDQGLMSPESGDGSGDGVNRTSRKRRLVDDDKSENSRYEGKVMGAHTRDLSRHSRSRSPPTLREDVKSRRRRPSYDSLAIP
jgi:protein FRA10AC1